MSKPFECVCDSGRIDNIFENFSDLKYILLKVEYS